MKVGLDSDKMQSVGIVTTVLNDMLEKGQSERLIRERGQRRGQLVLTRKIYIAEIEIAETGTTEMKDYNADINIESVKTAPHSPMCIVPRWEGRNIQIVYIISLPMLQYRRFQNQGSLHTLKLLYTLCEVCNFAIAHTVPKSASILFCLKFKSFYGTFVHV